mgnify:CR=1 FL=1
MENFFIKGSEYRDTGSWRYKNDDQFNLAFASGNKSIENCGGIRRRYFLNDGIDFRSQLDNKKIPSVLVLITTKNSISGRLDNPWNDELKNNHLTYFGDNRSARPFEDMKGCQNLININQLKKSEQAFLVPPILHFLKSKSGFVKFTGRYEISNIDVYPFVYEGTHIENLKCELDLVDDKIDMKWIRERSLALNVKELKLLDKKYLI